MSSGTCCKIVWRFSGYRYRPIMKVCGLVTWFSSYPIPAWYKGYWQNCCEQAVVDLWILPGMKVQSLLICSRFLTKTFPSADKKMWYDTDLHLTSKRCYRSLQYVSFARDAKMRFVWNDRVERRWIVFDCFRHFLWEPKAISIILVAQSSVTFAVYTGAIVSHHE